MGKSIVFLMYHELELPGRSLIQSSSGYVRYIISRDSFESQILWLKKNGWLGLSVSEALHYPDGKSIAITFDDGCETDLIAAAPILRQNGFNATFYVTAGFIGRSGYLSPAQLRELHLLNFEIGCHSMTHAYLDDLEPADLQREIADAGKKIGDIIGQRVEHFSCPGGRYSTAAIEVAKQSGYRSLATSRVEANSPATDPFLLGRVAIMCGANNSIFERICTGEALAQMRWKESVRGAARKLLGNTLYDQVRTRLLR
jgi:peptidoglycan/xylan/chitin deacetylase (PgdA/CDA1 family)